MDVSVNKEKHAPHAFSPSLALRVIAPPLGDVVAIGKGAGQVVVRALVYHRVDGRTIEHDERVLRQVNLMDLLEDLLAHAGICRGLFLDKQLIQGRVAVEVEVASSKVIGRRWELVAGE